MTLVLDSGVVYAYYDCDDAWHQGARGFLDTEPGPLALPAVILPEVDHLLDTRIGSAARHALYEDVVEQVYLVVDLDAAGYRRIQELNHRYQDLGLGFVDAAVAATCERMQVRTLATTDRRHFPAISKDVALKLVPDRPAGSEGAPGSRGSADGRAATVDVRGTAPGGPARGPCRATARGTRSQGRRY